MKYQPLHFFSLFLFVLILASCDSSSSDTSEQYGIFPAENLDRARNYALADQNSALLIWHDGGLILEEYRFSNPKTAHPIFSGTKSFAGILAAIAVRDGLFTFDTKLGDLIESWDPETERGSVTVRELLNLTSGIETAPVGAFQGQTPEVWLNAPMAFERGTTFVYGPTPFYLLANIFIDTFSINPANYLNEHLFDPLGLSRPVWQINLAGSIPNLSFGAFYPAFDWLQIGLMLLNNGTLNGTTIIPPDIFSELLQPGYAAPAYGITFWLNKPVVPGTDFYNRLPGGTGISGDGFLISSAAPADTYMKSGAFGQKLYVIPSLDVVIVRFGPVGEFFSDHQFFTRLMQGVEAPTI